jgi:FkbM family methyltransferase
MNKKSPQKELRTIQKIVKSAKYILGTVCTYMLKETGMLFEVVDNDSRAKLILYKLGVIKNMNFHFGKLIVTVKGYRILFEYKGHRVRFAFDNYRQLCNSLYLIKEQFAEETYAWLNVAGEVVINIGACVGDTAIYFALNGASEVYGYEPFPYTYSTAMKNTKAYKQIHIYREAVGGGHKTIYLSPKGTFMGTSTDARGEVPVQQITIKEAIARTKAPSYVMEMDCEGAESEIFKSVDKSTLEGCKKLMIECHVNSEPILSKLRELGFKAYTEKGLIRAAK